ncbi:hypothetical protein ACIXT9_02445 [Bacteroides fragilis]
MAFTEAEEAKLRAISTAFDNGKTIDQLPKADSNSPSKYIIEGQNKETGESVQVPLQDVVSVANSQVATRRWNTKNATPIGEAFGNLDYLRALPGLLGLGCYLVQPDRSWKKLDTTNHYRFADGSPAKLDGSMGDYMFCWNKHYYAWWVEGDWYYEAVSMSPIPGRWNYVIPAGGTSALGAGVVDRTTTTLVSVVSDDVKFRGGNNDAAKDAAYNTLLGRVATALPAATFGSYARKKGEGWESGWFVHNSVVGYLFRIIFGTRNVQSAYNANKDANGLYQGGLGSGVTNAGSWWGNDFGYYPFVPTSAGVELGDACGVSTYNVIGKDGSVVYAAPVPCFFGLKNFYGHIGLIERGSLIQKKEGGGGDYYVAPSMFANFNINSIEGLIKSAEVPANSPAGWKYITQISMQNLCQAPTVASATESTYYSDGWYNDNASSGLRCPFRRGTANYGVSAGLLYIYGSVVVSLSDADWSSPLCFLAEDVSPVPVWGS